MFDAVLSRYAHPESRAGQRLPMTDEERIGLELIWAQVFFDAGAKLIEDEQPSAGNEQAIEFLSATGALEDRDN